MRILTFTTLFPNSEQPWHGIFVYRRVAQLARRPGNFVTVVAPVPYAPTWSPVPRWRTTSSISSEELMGSLTIYHPRYFVLPKISMIFHGLLMFAGSMSLVRRLHKENRFDCIDAHYVYPDGFAAALLGKKLGIPVIISARGTDINVFPSFKLIRPMIRWTMQHSAGAVGVCESLTKAMLNLGALPNKTCTIGNGVDAELFTPVGRSYARRQLSMPEDSKIIVSVGNLVPVKRHGVLISAFAQLVSKYPQIRLYLVGEGHLRKKLEAQAKREGLSGRVFFAGRRPNEELKLWYGAADVSCLASSREGWANVILESLACGTPVVATSVGGAPEIIASSHLGILVEQSEESIARGLQRALQQEWNRETLVRFARSRNWSVVAEEVQNFLNARLSTERHSVLKPNEV